MSGSEPTLAEFDRLIDGLIHGKRPKTRWKRFLHALGLYREEYTVEEVEQIMRAKRLP